MAKSCVVYCGDSSREFVNVARDYDGRGGTEVYVWEVHKGGGVSSVMCAVISSPELCAAIDGILDKYTVVRSDAVLDDVYRATCSYPPGVPMMVVSDAVRSGLEQSFADVVGASDVSKGATLDSLLEERAVKQFRS